MSSRPVDPRATITPDSFTVAPGLLGLPLARPWRRAIAMAIDGILVAILANAGGVFLAIAAAVALWTASRPSATAGMARRGVVGVLRIGAAVFLFSAVLAIANSLSNRDRGEEREDLDPDAVAALLETVEDSTARAIIEAVVETPVTQSAAEPAADSALIAYAAALQRDDSAALDSLRPGAAEAVAADRLASLERQRDALRESNRTLNRQLAESEESARGVTGFFRRVADDLGVGFGWDALYFTAFLALWRGQTPGKRALGVRVIRLDGRPVGWWIAFERFGGYAASFSTGLLGFAQILWDRNRQGLHDKAVETVVIRDLPPSSTEGGGWQPAGR